MTAAIRHGASALVGQISIDIRNATFDGGSLGVYVLSRGGTSLTVKNSLFRDLTDAGVLTWGGHSVSISDSQFLRCNVGVYSQNNNWEPPTSMTLRSVSIQECSESGVSLLSRKGNQHWDLGTLESSGNNTITGNNRSRAANAANVSFNSEESFVIEAVGNTWDPNVQGANEVGRYPVDGSGAVLEMTYATGSNFVSPETNLATLRLAQNPL
jgi:hypothetical protein